MAFAPSCRGNSEFPAEMESEHAEACVAAGDCHGADFRAGFFKEFTGFFESQPDLPGAKGFAKLRAKQADEISRTAMT